MTPETAIKEAGQHYLPVIYRRIILALAAETLDRVQLAIKIKAEKKTVDNAIVKLRQWGLIYVYDWKRVQGVSNITPVWALGDQKDEPKPKPKSNAQKCADYRKRHTPAHVTLGIWNL